MYWRSFKDAGYTDARMLEDLKGMNKETLEQTLHVHKVGHINKLYNAIKKLRYPTPGMIVAWETVYSAMKLEKQK